MFDYYVFYNMIPKYPAGIFQPYNNRTSANNSEYIKR